MEFVPWFAQSVLRELTNELRGSLLPIYLGASYESKISRLGRSLTGLATLSVEPDLSHCVPVLGDLLYC